MVWKMRTEERQGDGPKREIKVIEDLKTKENEVDRGSMSFDFSTHPPKILQILKNHCSLVMGLKIVDFGSGVCFFGGLAYFDPQFFFGGFACLLLPLTIPLASPLVRSAIFPFLLIVLNLL